MYRLLILYLAAAAAAPQDNSITYNKQQPDELLTAPSYASPVIEPLTQESEYTDESLADDAGAQTTASTEDATLEESTEATEAAVTERYVPKTTLTPKFKKAPPKFYSKLSYFEKPNYSSLSPNLVERNSKRKFRSRCRCEKISNCPKLQITVPRCPEEQFLCCF